MKGMRKTVAMAAVLSAVISVVITIISMLGMHKLLAFMNTPSDIFADAYEYIYDYLCRDCGTGAL